MTPRIHLHDDPPAYCELAVNVDGFSRLSGELRIASRSDLTKILDTAAGAASVDRSGWIVQDRGDGELALIPGSVPKAVLIADFVAELAAGLGTYNASRGGEGPMRLRIAFHHGAARTGRGGLPGEAPEMASRLADSFPVRAALAERPGVDLALILSDQMFQDTVATGERGLDRRRFARVEISEQRLQGVAWISVPDQAPRPPHTVT
jgi:class 3 adenylate cyclase